MCIYVEKDVWCVRVCVLLYINFLSQLSAESLRRFITIWKSLEKTFPFDADWGWLLTRSVYGSYKTSLSDPLSPPHPLMDDLESFMFLFSKMTDNTGLAISGNR